MKRGERTEPKTESPATTDWSDGIRGKEREESFWLPVASLVLSNRKGKGKKGGGEKKRKGRVRGKEREEETLSMGAS